MHIAYSTLSMIDDRSTLNVPALRSFSFKSEKIALSLPITKISKRDYINCPFKFLT